VFRQGLSTKILIVSEMARLLLGLLTIMVLERTFGAVVLGVYLSITLMTQIMARAIDLGLPVAVGYFLRVEPRGLRDIVFAFGLHTAGTIPVAVFLVFLLSVFPFGEEASRSIVRTTGWAVVLLAVSEMVANLARAVLIPRKQFVGHLAINILTPVTFLLIVWTDIAHRGVAGIDAQALVVDMATAAAATAVVSSLVMAVSTVHSPRGHHSVRELYAYAAKAYLSAIAKVMAQRSDRLLLTSLLGASDYAYYSVAVSLRDMMVFPAQSYSLALRNIQIDLVVRARRPDKARNLLLRVVLIWILVGTVAAAVMIPIWPVLVGIAFSPEFAPVAGFIQILAFTCGPLAAMSVAWNHLYSLHRPGRVTVLTGLCLFVSIPIFVVFLSIFDAGFAAAFASLVWAVLSVTASVVWAARSDDWKNRKGSIDAPPL
jgi:O-antigen/teichoic acid export membrane protein